MRLLEQYSLEGWSYTSVTTPTATDYQYTDPVIIQRPYYIFTVCCMQAPSVGGMKVPFPPLSEDVEAKSHSSQQKRKATVRLPMEPKYTVVHCGEFTMQDFTNSRESTLIKRPRELVVSVELPGVESAGSVELDIFEKRVVLKVEKPKLQLDVSMVSFSVVLLPPWLCPPLHCPVD